MTDFMFAGSISHGTLREEDLVPAFLDVLEVLNLDRAWEIRNSYVDAIEHLQTGLEPSAEDRASLMEVLFDALDAEAPKGYTFGAHEGDGSDFGFWQVEVEVAVTYTFVVSVPHGYLQGDVSQAVEDYINSVGFALDNPVKIEEV